jgi:hypothetical protein
MINLTKAAEAGVLVKRIIIGKVGLLQVTVRGELEVERHQQWAALGFHKCRKA